MNFLRKCLLALLFIISTESFINIIPTKKLTYIPKKLNEENLCNNCNEKVIYRNYLLGLRKVRKTLKTTNIDALISILNFTNAFVENTTWPVNSTQFNNEEIGAKKLIMSNIHIDVSNVKYIQICTRNDSIIIELDKKNKLNNILTEINNIDALINTLSLMLKMININ